ncbi:hypothetical protein L6452_13466 [Arctium lappa]|uniref:Uncharacterized protein n=1 Tax=Arctium lappa TaxID=4217 RepID=A0ACB9CIE7_ARCLA|nr:hypothetical protein L6452_13466 [Arctium lappa]
MSFVVYISPSNSIRFSPPIIPQKLPKIGVPIWFISPKTKSYVLQKIKNTKRYYCSKFNQDLVETEHM